MRGPLDISAILCYRITPSYGLAWHSLLAAPRPCRRLPPFFQASRLAGGCFSNRRLSSFRGRNLTFCVSGVDYMAFLKNYPIPQEVKGMADGDSLRQLFCVFGLDFHACAWYCTVHPFGNRCRTCSNFAGGFVHVSTGCLCFELGNRKMAVFEAR